MMKKTTVVPCLALALLFSSVAAAAPSGKEKDVSKEHEARYEKKFAEQDKILVEAKALEDKKEYDRAIQLITDKVYKELKKDKNDVNAWKVQQRYRAVGKKLQELRLKSGEEKMRRAKEAFAAENYTEAVNFAVTAGEVCPALKATSDAWKTAALERKRNSQRAADMSAATANPNLDSDEKKIVRELAIARTLIKNKRYEDARRHIEEVYKLNPFNAEAAFLAGEIYKKFYQAGHQRRRADIESMKAVEGWQWVEPAFLRDNSANNVPEGMLEGTSDQGINAKLDAIIFPKIRWDETEILAAIEYLNRYSKNNDPDKEGVIIDYNAGSNTRKTLQKNTGNNPHLPPMEQPGLEGGNPIASPMGNMPQQGGNQKVQAKDEHLVTLSVDNVSLRELLDYISFLTNLPYTVLPGRVIVGNGGDEMITTRFEISSDARNRISNFAGGGDSSADETGEAPSPNMPKDTADSGAEPGGENAEGGLTQGKAKVTQIKPDNLKKFFAIYGIDFGENASISDNGRGKLYVTNTQDNISKIGDVLRLINTPKPMVRVEVKSIEISDIDMQQLGFEWTLGTLQSSNGGNRITTGSVGSDAVVGGATSMLRSALSGVDSKLISNLNLFPDIFGSIKPFGSDESLNLSLTIDALDRSDRTETISAPTVTVSDGMEGYVSMGKEYYFPTGWDELEIDMDSGSQSSSWNFTITRPTPEFDESTFIGTEFTVTPSIKNDNYTIFLDIHPKITAYLGPENYQMTVYIKRGDDDEKTAYETFNIWRPIISTRELQLKVNVYDGEILVLGALADSKAGSRLDKIPILGDIPLIGRLFQSHSETSTRKNMLIFVTARLVNDAGLPIRRLEHSGGAIPEANR